MTSGNQQFFCQQKNDETASQLSGTDACHSGNALFCGRLGKQALELSTYHTLSINVYKLSLSAQLGHPPPHPTNFDLVKVKDNS